MNQDEIIEMAEQSNLLGVIDSFHYDTKNWVEEAMAFAKLVAAKEREFCKKECMEQFELSLSANEKAKRAIDKEAYLNLAIGAKYCLMRIDARGEA